MSFENRDFGCWESAFFWSVFLRARKNISLQRNPLSDHYVRWFYRKHEIRTGPNLMFLRKRIMIQKFFIKKVRFGPVRISCFYTFLRKELSGGRIELPSQFRKHMPELPLPTGIPLVRVATQKLAAVVRSNYFQPAVI